MFQITDCVSEILPLDLWYFFYNWNWHEYVYYTVQQQYHWCSECYNYLLNYIYPAVRLQSSACARQNVRRRWRPIALWAPVGWYRHRHYLWYQRYHWYRTELGLSKPVLAKNTAPYIIPLWSRYIVNPAGRIQQWFWIYCIIFNIPPAARCHHPRGISAVQRQNV